MKKAHTPGPWVMVNGGKDDCVIQKSTGRIICEISRNFATGNKAHQGRTHADARLIAAAPDLLQVAQHALYLIEHGFEISPAGLADLRAAINKATQGE